MNKKGMSEILKKTLIISALLVISIHAFIVHPHSDWLSDKEHNELHQNSHSFYGILKIVFHESNDESLDNLVVYQNYLLKKLTKNHSCSLFEVCSNQYGIEKTVTGNIVKRYTNKSYNLFIVNLNGVRGPPNIA